MGNKRKSKDTTYNSKSKKKNTINVELLTDDSKILDVTKKILSGSEVEHQDVTVIKDPFTCIQIKNFIKDKTFVEELENDLMNLIFNEKLNDLYQFKQSDDLKDCTLVNIKSFREKLFSDMKSFLENLTDIKLDDVPDMSCAKYQYTDRLNCHDDELETRVIAFIYYLVPHDWSIQDGGCLDLFACDEKLQPISIKKSVLPVRNSFTFFYVNEKSYHQVAEVLSETKTRLSISGWFHGKSPERQERFVMSPPRMIPAIEKDNEILLSWINPTYLQREIVDDIQEQFEEESEIQLTDFLIKEKYESVLSELKNADVHWMFQGPYHIRCCWTLSKETLDIETPNLKQLITLLSSKPFFRLLKKLTDLDLCEHDDSDSEEAEKLNNSVAHKKEKPQSSSCSGENSSKKVNNSKKQAGCHSNVYSWKNQCYTLMTDSDSANDREFQLDSFLHFQCEGWSADEMGGSTTYISSDTDEELLRVEPMASNCLSLVYRDSNTSRFTNYINSKSKSLNFYSIETTYVEG